MHLVEEIYVSGIYPEHLAEILVPFLQLSCLLDGLSELRSLLLKLLASMEFLSYFLFRLVMVFSGF